MASVSSVSQHSGCDIALCMYSFQAGGSFRIVVDLANHLHEKGFKPTILVVRKQGVWLESLNPDVPVYETGASIKTAAWLEMRLAVPRFAKALRTLNPKVVMSAGTHANLSTMLAKRKSRLKNTVSIARLSNPVIRKDKPWPVRVLHHMRVRASLPKADKVIAISKGLKAEIIQYLAFSPEDVEVIYDPVVDDSVLMRQTESVDDPWLTVSDAPLLISVGRLNRQKDYETLLKAFSELRKRRPCRLVILGEGPYRKKIESLAAQLKLGNDFYLPGYASNPFAWMAKADLFVLSSLYEGQPNVLIEALACGCPVVSTDSSPGVRELISSSDLGLIVEIGNVQQISEAMEKSLSISWDSDVLRQGSNKNRKENQINKYIDFIKRNF